MPDNPTSLAKTNADKLFIFVHIAFALTIVSQLFGLILAIVLIIKTKSDTTDQYIKYLIKTILIYFVITFLFAILLIYFNQFLHNVPRNIFEMFSNYLSFYSIIITALTLVPTIWLYFRIAGGWFVFFFQKPIDGHFGIRLRKV